MIMLYHTPCTHTRVHALRPLGTRPHNIPTSRDSLSPPPPPSPPTLSPLPPLSPTLGTRPHMIPTPRAGGWNDQRSGRQKRVRESKRFATRPATEDRSTTPPVRFSCPGRFSCESHRPRGRHCCAHVPQLESSSNTSFIQHRHNNQHQQQLVGPGLERFQGPAPAVGRGSRRYRVLAPICLGP